MELSYQSYQKLTAGQRKLLCFLAYTGKKTDEKLLSVYRHVEDMKADQLKKLVNSLRGFYDTGFYSYRSEYELHVFHIAPLMLYMLEVMPQWMQHFDNFYKKHQSPQAMMLMHRLECCLEGKPVEVSRATVYRDADILVPLASDERFMPLMTNLFDINRFVQNVLVYQLEHDIADPENLIGKIAASYYRRMVTAHARELKAIVALYDFIKQGRYDDKIASQKGLYGSLLAGAQALYAGDYATAFNMMAIAIRETNKTRQGPSKGFFYRVLNNYLLVLSYYFYKADEGKKLAALVKKDYFMQNRESKPASWLASYFSTGALPSQKTLSDYLTSRAGDASTKLERYLALLVSRFLHIDVQWPEDLPPVPDIRILRHELSPWLSLTDEERQQLAEDSSAISSRGNCCLRN